MNTINKYEETLTTITIRDFAIAWKKASNDKKIKPVLVEHTYGNLTYKTKEKGWIYPEHHIMYNLVRNLPLDRGFKLNSEGYNSALYNLNNLYYSNTEKKLFNPFQNSMDFETFKSILTEIRSTLKTK